MKKFGLVLLLQMLLWTNVVLADRSASCVESITAFTDAVRDLTPDEIPLDRLIDDLTPSHLSYSPLVAFKRESLPGEDQLRTGNIISSMDAHDGIYHPINYQTTRIVRLDNGVSGVWKPHTEVWHSNYRTEILAYELDQIFGFNRVPPTVEREFDGVKGSIQLYVIGGSKQNIAKKEYDRMALFDFLIDNRDRHSGNFLGDRMSGKAVWIDHGISLSGTRGREHIELEDVLPKIERFFQTEDGPMIAENLSTLVDSDEFYLKVVSYIGSQDTDKLIVRMKQALEIYERTAP